MTRPAKLLPLLATGAALAAGACTGEPSLGELESELSLIPRGATCAQLGLGSQSLTLPGPVAEGVYALDAQNSVALTYYDDTNTIFFFNQATIKITGVLVSIGDHTLMWDIPGGSDAWPSLHGPPDPFTGEIRTAEEVSFCYDYNLVVQPSPYAHHANRQSWTISRSGLSDTLVLAEGQSELIEAAVTVTPGTAISEGQYIEGPVFIINASPSTVTVGAVATMVGDLAADVTCPTPPPFAMAPFQVVVCEFRADVPDIADRNVVGSAVVSHGLHVVTQEVVASFAAHNTGTTTIDNCIDVLDDAVPGDQLLGTTCVADGPVTFELSEEVGPFDCGAFAVTRTASFVGLDTGASGDASWVVNGEVRCNPGCTLSAAYWKNHTDASPRRYNPIWNLIGAQGEYTSFFSSGLTYGGAIVRPVQGNPYWTLARAYIAVRLNQLNGAQLTPGTTAAFTTATGLFNTYTPAQAIASATVRKNFVKTAALLKDFNSGRIGPGRCTCKPDLDD